MKKTKTTGSLNLEMALLIALLALAVIFGLTWMGGGIATTFNNAADFLLGSGGGSGSGGTDPAWVGGPLEVTGGVDISTGILEQDDAGNIEAVYVDIGPNQDGSDGDYEHIVRVVDYTQGGLGEPIQLASGSVPPLTTVPLTLYEKDNTTAGLEGDWVLVGDFIGGQEKVFPGVNGKYYQVRDGNVIIGTVFMTDITGMTFDYTNGRMLNYKDESGNNRVMVSPSSIEVQDGITYPITTVGGELGSNQSCYYSPDAFPTRGFGQVCETPNSNNLLVVVYENGITRIWNQYDWESPTIVSVSLPDTVKEILGGFRYWSKLTSVTIPNNVTNIGGGAFAGTGLKSINIPNSVTNIGKRTFYGCSGLTSVTIPNSVTILECSAFANCSGLTSVTIPNSVTSIGDWALAGCSGLTEIDIPNSVTSIGYNAFYICSGLTEIDIPDSVTSIGNNAFWGCSDLTRVTIPDSVTSIGAGTFSYCSLTSITIPNSVTSIGNYAFQGCSGLTSVTIPDSVTNIGDYAFDGCPSLTSIIIDNTPDAIPGKPWGGYSADIIWLQ